MVNNYDYKMFVADGCPFCAQAKEKLKDKIANGKIEILNVIHNPAASELAKKHNIRDVPTFLVKDNVLNTTEVCDLTKDARKLMCNGKEVVL